MDMVLAWLATYHDYLSDKNGPATYEQSLLQLEAMELGVIQRSPALYLSKEIVGHKEPMRVRDVKKTRVFDTYRSTLRSAPDYDAKFVRNALESLIHAVPRIHDTEIIRIRVNATLTITTHHMLLFRMLNELLDGVAHATNHISPTSVRVAVVLVLTEKQLLAFPQSLRSWWQSAQPPAVDNFCARSAVDAPRFRLTDDRFQVFVETVER